MDDHAAQFCVANQVAIFDVDLILPKVVDDDRIPLLFISSAVEDDPRCNVRRDQQYPECRQTYFVSPMHSEVSSPVGVLTMRYRVRAAGALVSIGCDGLQTGAANRKRGGRHWRDPLCMACGLRNRCGCLQLHLFVLLLRGLDLLDDLRRDRDGLSFWRRRRRDDRLRFEAVLLLGDPDRHGDHA